VSWVIINLRPAVPSDDAALTGLAETCLPDLVKLRSLPWDNRRGDGGRWQEQYLLVAESAFDGVVAFAWAMPVLALELGLGVPWWMLNALAVSPEYRGSGLGAALIGEVFDRADRSGVASLYGLCDPGFAPWYGRRGFSISDTGESLGSNVALSDKADAGEVEQTLELLPEPGRVWFVTDVAAGDLPRLLV
jgi:GNAT superfamily N-acetyltransferase